MTPAAQADPVPLEDLVPGQEVAHKVRHASLLHLLDDGAVGPLAVDIMTPDNLKMIDCLNLVAIVLYSCFAHLQTKQGGLGAEVHLAGPGVPVSELLENHPPDEAPAIRRGLPTSPDLRRSVLSKCFYKILTHKLYPLLLT